ncbi:MAG TPA: prolyl oligopeptidase family serine peptidase [Streptosporangiaceae bacterium]|nr:prolyl oligopeptidase family serine peptidase [Streptosporangiaceae bacterium]
MLKFPHRLTAAIAPALLLAGIVSAAGPASASTSTAPAACPAAIVPGDTVLCGSLTDGATYLIEVPAAWNHDLFLYSHGYVAPGSSNPAQDVGDPATGAWLLTHGFALAGSSYATTGWAIAQALPDQISTLDLFDQQVGDPAQTIAWGHSLGGIITAGLIQSYPDRFDAALPMCGVLSGGVATWNTALDAAFAFQQLAYPSTLPPLQVVHITNPLANLQNAEQAVAADQATPQGQARLALAAALGDTPGWFTTGSPEPGPTDYAAQEANQFLWDTKVDFPFIFAFRAELEARAGGNPSWNTGVDYYRQLARSADRAEVVALYQAAGLNLNADLRTLQQATRISADPAAVSYLTSNITFNGQISVPVLTMHTTGDGLVVPENERAYADVVRQAGNGGLLRQVYVSRAGHCAFTPAETITAVQVLLHRLSTGHWDSDSLSPASMNAAAATLPSVDNPLPPAFIQFKPTRYLRPFDAP